MISSPIVVIIFNRPQISAQLRDSLRDEESRELFVISDGPRIGRPGESRLVEECRNLFSDWPNEVHINYSETNLGCRNRIISGLNWVFKHTSRAIILEDDCLAHPVFFRFCDVLLETYADCDSVMSICGNKSFPGSFSGKDYAFSKYSSCWGWATWKRAWSTYDDQLANYPLFTILKALRKKLDSTRAAIYWTYIANSILSGKINSWAYFWTLNCFFNNGIHIYPDQNLIINHGFGSDSTHTRHRLHHAPTEFGKPISFPLSKPDSIEPNPAMDRWLEDTVFSKSLKNRLKWLFSNY